MSGRLMLAGVLLCFFVSGFSALLYQTAWLRQFSLVFGTSELAVAAVLAAYMGGLALGAALATRFIRLVTRPILTYGLLEAGIALAALLVPLLLSVAGVLYVAVLGDLAELPDARTFGQPVFYLIVAFIVLVLPTSMMGATLPLLTRFAVRTDREVGPGVAALYSINTAGAVAGALVAAFGLLPAVGLAATVWTGIAGNALVFVTAVMLARAAVTPAAESPATGRLQSPGFREACLQPLLAGGRTLSVRLAAACRNQPVWVLPLMLVAGANAFFYEVLWTRMLSHVLGGSIYAFATMLAAFLAGIAIGGGFGGMAASGRERAARMFGIVQAAVAVSAVGVYAWMQALVPETRGTQQFAIYAVLVMLPATVFIGATYPLAVRVLSADERDAGRAAGRVYSWNTVGAIFGAVLAAFWLIPALGFAGSIKLAVSVNCAVALAAAAVLAPVNRRHVIAAAGLLALALLAWYPGRPQSVIASTAFEIADGAAGREIYFGVGRSSTVLLNEADGYFDLRTNGLPEAAILPAGAAPVGQVQQWLAALPVIARPAAASMLLVGFGGGVALEDAPASLQTIDVLELEPEVVEANLRLRGIRLQDPLADGRIKIVFNDARNALRLSEKRFDVIVSQPSHPWTAGASHLFSREFFALAREHLTDDGVYLQWMSAGFVDAELLRSLTATLLDVFENVRLYQPAPSVLLFLAADTQLDPEGNLAATGQPLSSDPLYYGYMRLNGVSDLAAALMLDEAGTRALAGAAPLTTDNMNRMATASRSLADGLTSDQLDVLLAPFDPLSERDGRLRTELGDRIDFIYVASRLLADGQPERAARLAASVTDPYLAALIDGLVAGARGDLQAAQGAFQNALSGGGAIGESARYALVQPALPDLASGRAGAAVRALADGLRGTPAAVVAGWRLAAEGDWPALAALDPELARAATTALWFPDAVQLRADWRTRVRGESAVTAGREAMRMVDRALVIRPTFDLLVLRASAAAAAEDSNAFIESTRYALQHVRDRLDEVEARGARPGRTELSKMFTQLLAMRGLVVQQPDERSRTGPISDRLGEQLARIQALQR